MKNVPFSVIQLDSMALLVEHEPPNLLD